MKATGFVHKYGDHVDTDVIIPARYLNTQSHKELAAHCMEDIDKDFIGKVREGDIMVAGANFGCGSSREHAPIAIAASGISCVIAKSFARIHVANLINAGILPLTFENPEDYDKLSQDNVLELKDIFAGMDAGRISVTDKTTGNSFNAVCNFTDRQKAILKAGGLLNYTKEGGQ